MATRIFEPGHTEAEFRARHMMVTWVRGLFKDIHGQLELDRERCLDATFQGEIDATGIWTGQPERDEHLRSADFLDVQNHPSITFAGRFTERTGATTFKGQVELTIRGVTRTVQLDIASSGNGRPRSGLGGEQGRDARIGFEATARIDRHDFGVSWQDEIPGGGVVARDEIDLVLDVEAILLEDLERTGAIEYYPRLTAKSPCRRNTPGTTDKRTGISKRTDLPLTGGCACGAVRFEVTEPLVAASYCHCKRCQRRSGAAASPNAHPAVGAFRIVAGEDKLRVWKPQGGGEKWFCGECGSSLFGRNPSHADPVGIRMGTFDHDPGIRPGVRQFIAYAAPWEPIPDDGLPRHPESRHRQAT